MEIILDYLTKCNTIESVMAIEKLLTMTYQLESTQKLYEGLLSDYDKLTKLLYKNKDIVELERLIVEKDRIATEKNDLGKKVEKLEQLNLNLNNENIKLKTDLKAILKLTE